MQIEPDDYLHSLVEELNSGLPKTNTESGREEDFKPSTLNHSAT